MIILGNPPDPENYYLISGSIVTKLQEKGLPPKYRNKSVFFFERTPKADKILNELGYGF